MRQISDIALNTLLQAEGIEPLNIIEIYFESYTYICADQEIAGYAYGTILEIANLESVLRIDGQTGSDSITLVLSDINGILKTIYNNSDIHKRQVKLYQWFKGIGIEEKFLIYQGQINSPIVWKEGDRTLTFDVVTRIEDQEVGFSPEEGLFSGMPIEVVGDAWPLCFGTPVNVPGKTYQKVVNPTMLNGYGMFFYKGGDEKPITPPRGVRPTVWNLNATIDEIEAEINKEVMLQAEYEAFIHEITEETIRMANERRDKYLEAYNNVVNYNVENGHGLDGSKIYVLNGDLVPAGKVLDVRVNDYPLHAIFSSVGTVKLWPRRQLSDRPQKPYEYQYMWWDGWDEEIIGVPNDVLEKNEDGFFVTQMETEFFQGGSNIVVESGGVFVDYIVNILPSTVHWVKAYRTINRVRTLTLVPSNLYNVLIIPMGELRITVVRFDRPLSVIRKEDWENDIYVTLTSPVGPNIVNIIKWIVENNTFLKVDTESFAATRPLVAMYPANFALFDRKNVMTLIADIAFQSRCATWIKDDTIYIRYLSSNPVSVDTIVEQDINTQTLQITSTPTEDIVTKLIATWKMDYAQEEEYKLILRYNIYKYGIQEQTYDFYIYNSYDLVEKSATFWLIRKANIWKKLLIECFLNKLKLETYDYVTLDFDVNYVANDNVVGLIESTQYDSANHKISFELWVPVRLGEMIIYDFAHPADLEIDRKFPTVVDVKTYTPGTRIEVAGKLPKIMGDKTTGSQLHVVPPNRTLYGDYIEKFRKDREAWERNQAKYQHKLDRAEGFIDIISPDFGGSDQVQWPEGAWRPSLGYNPTEFDQGRYYPSDRGDVLPTLVPPTSQSLKYVAVPLIDNTLSPAKKFIWDPDWLNEAMGAGIPAKVVQQTGEDQTKYIVTIYPYGIANEGRNVVAKQLQIVDSEVIPEDTWAIAIKLKDPDDNTIYYIQIPVWI